MEWHEAVYAPGRDGSRPPLEVTAFVYARDKGRCVSCGRKSRLTLHHIVPRSRGGVDEAMNLATLCVSCHDSIEPLGLPWSEVRGWKRNNSKRKVKPAPEPPPEHDWHAYVYGGCRRPD